MEQNVVTTINNGNNNVTTKDNCNSNDDDNHIINLEKGDPKMFYSYWKKLDNECSITIKASELLSYSINPKEPDFFYQMPELIEAVRRVHRLVGNAVTEDRYIIGGTGSAQLFTVALRALASTIKETSNNKRVPVVCAEPYYSFYKEAIELEQSDLYEWHGDANTFKADLGPCVEVVTSPNNPDGRSRKPVVKGEGAVVINDLAYYWPHYTPITSPADDDDVMLFTLSKATGHAGSRVGWAIVKDGEIAKKMKKQMLMMSIGMCHDGQFRATKILNFVADRYERVEHYKDEKQQNNVPMLFQVEGIFDYGHRVLAQRWEKLRAIVQRTQAFSLPHFNSGFCNFLQKVTSPTPAFAWVECKTSEDAEQLTNKLKIQARIGTRFGVNISGRFIRVSMMDDDHSFNLFLQRLSSLTIEDESCVDSPISTI